MQKKLLKVNPSDNVIVALTDLSQGENLNFEGNEITTLASATMIVTEIPITNAGFNSTVTANAEQIPNT